MTHANPILNPSSKQLDHLTSLKNLSTSDIHEILDRGDYYVTQNSSRQKKCSLLSGKTIINVFLENSTRTRLSFEIAAQRLGADVVTMGVDGSSLQKGESLVDTLHTLNAMQPDALILRHSENIAPKLAEKHCFCPILNAGNGTDEHPTQALLDALTIRQVYGRLDGLTIAICGDIKHSRVAHSNQILLEKMGANIHFIGPEELLPHDQKNTFTSMAEGLKNADIVMVLRLQKERMRQTLSMSEETYFNQYGLTHEKLSAAKENAFIMHPGPMNRGIEIASDVAGDPKRSLILRQVENGVAIRMSCLDLLLS